MATELFATYFVYVLAMVVVRYRRHSWFIYLLICFLVNGVWGGIRYMMISPFYLGVLLADLETKENPPLNYLRKDTKVAKSIKFVMFVLAVLWASDTCLWDLPDLFGFVLFENYTDINAPFFLFIVVLTSDTCRQILETRFMRFLGKTSFMMYLIHPLIFGGFMADFYIYLVWKKMDPILANVISFLVFTPVLFAISHFLTVYVDIPAKDFAFNMDTYFRDARP